MAAQTPVAPVTASPIDEHPPPVQSQDGRSGRAVAALVLGVIAIPAALMPLAGWILGIVAIVLGLTARSDARRKGCRGGAQALAGALLGVLALLVATGVLVGVASMA
ncbi:MAG: DUF4190 domain-containing protein [Actinomycetota bacterium]|nr:DUF4190 domain-containing protein [Actinomycetota bacterium]